MNREAGKGDDRRPESAPGAYAQGHEAIAWKATRTERQADQAAADAMRAENLSRTEKPMTHEQLRSSGYARLSMAHQMWMAERGHKL